MDIIFANTSSLKVQKNRKSKGAGELCGAAEAMKFFDVSDKTLRKYRQVGIVRTHGIGGSTKTANLYYRHVLLVQAQLKEDLIQSVAASGRPTNEWIGQRCQAIGGQDDGLLIDLLNERGLSVEDVVSLFREILQRVYDIDQMMPVDVILAEVESRLSKVDT